jgi:glutaredoxin-like protein NrdH
MEHVKGRDCGDLLLYTLSTCIWCKKTKKLLNELGVAYRFIDVDLLEGEEEDRVQAEMAAYTSKVSFPLVILDGEKLCAGYEEDKMRKKFKE